MTQLSRLHSVSQCMWEMCANKRSAGALRITFSTLRVMCMCACVQGKSLRTANTCIASPWPIWGGGPGDFASISCLDHLGHTNHMVVCIAKCTAVMTSKSGCGYGIFLHAYMHRSARCTVEFQRTCIHIHTRSNLPVSQSLFSSVHLVYM